MSGIMLDVLRLDFAFMLDDWGQTVLVKHLTGETIAPLTGVKTKVENETHIQAIVESISKKDIDLFPATFSMSDRKVHFRELDASIEKGDVIEIEGENYTVHEIKKTCKIFTVLCKKM